MGCPGPLLRWTRDLLAGAAARGIARVVHIPIDEHSVWIPSQDTQVRLFFGDFVADRWASLIREHRMQVVAVIDDPVWSWDALCDTGHLSAEAIRNIVAIAMSLGDISLHPRVLTLTRADWHDPASVAARILDHAGFGAATAGDVWPALNATLDHAFPDDARPIVEGAVAPAFAYAATGQRGPVEWPRECLYWGDKPGEPAPRVIPLTGPARAVVYGPHYPLPPGRWTLRVSLAFSPDSCGAPLAIELHASADDGEAARARFPFVVQQPGVFAASVPVDVPSPREKLAFRLVIERGAIEGSVGIDRITFTPEPG